MTLETLHLIRLVAHICIFMLTALIIAWLWSIFNKTARQNRKAARFKKKRELVTVNKINTI